MDGKVVSINGRNSIDETNGNLVCPEFVEMIERLLVKVKAGEVTSMYACGFTDEGGCYRIAWFGNDSLFESVGIIEDMKLHYLREHTLEGDDES